MKETILIVAALACAGFSYILGENNARDEANAAAGVIVASNRAEVAQAHADTKRALTLASDALDAAELTLGLYDAEHAAREAAEQTRCYWLPPATLELDTFVSPDSFTLTGATL